MLRFSACPYVSACITPQACNAALRRCHIRPHKHEEPQPFLIQAEEVREIDADFNPDFLRHIFDRIVWSTLRTAAASMGGRRRFL